MALALAVPTVAAAHHGWSSYDDARPLRLSGAIVAFSYEQPHGTLQLKAADKTWDVILAPPTRMTSRGLSKKMLEPGTQASVEGYPHRTQNDELRAERITIAGKTVELR
jgi:uncharacterized protein DUF6152